MPYPGCCAGTCYCLELCRGVLYELVPVHDPGGILCTSDRLLSTALHGAMHHSMTRRHVQDVAMSAPGTPTSLTATLAAPLLLLLLTGY